MVVPSDEHLEDLPLQDLLPVGRFSQFVTFWKLKGTDGVFLTLLLSLQARLASARAGLAFRGQRPN